MLKSISNIIVTGICIIFITCSLGNDDKNSTQHTIINGTIVDEETNLPIDSVDVTFNQKISLFTNYYHGRDYTDSSGKFHFEDYYTPGEHDFLAYYYLNITKKEYYRKSGYKKILEDTENNLIIRLTPIPNEFHTIVSGKFLQNGTDSPISNVNVYFLRNVTYSSANWDTVGIEQSNNSGEFYVDDKYERQDTDERIPIYNLHYQKIGYIDHTNTQVISADSTKEFIYYLTPLSG